MALFSLSCGRQNHRAFQECWYSSYWGILKCFSEGRILWALEEGLIRLHTTDMLLFPISLSFGFLPQCARGVLQWSASLDTSVVLVLLAQLCQALCDAMDCGPPGSSVHEIFQARILEWVAISFSRGSSQHRDRTWVSCTAGRFFTDWATREALVRHRALLNTIFSYSTKQMIRTTPNRLNCNITPWIAGKLTHIDKDDLMLLHFILLSLMLWESIHTHIPKVPVNTNGKKPQFLWNTTSSSCRRSFRFSPGLW